jgi:hypothetical protein
MESLMVRGRDQLWGTAASCIDTADIERSVLPQGEKWYTENKSAIMGEQTGARCG